MSRNNHKYIKIVTGRHQCYQKIKQKSWASLVKHLLSSMGFMFAWSARSIGDTDAYLLFIVKQRRIRLSRIGELDV